MNRSAPSYRSEHELRHVDLGRKFMNLFSHHLADFDPLSHDLDLTIDISRSAAAWTALAKSVAGTSEEHKGKTTMPVAPKARGWLTQTFSVVHAQSKEVPLLLLPRCSP